MFRQKRIARSAKTERIVEGLKYFIRPVQTKRITTKRMSEMT